MNFIDIDCVERKNEWYISDAQSHNYYELYFLLDGNRRFFHNDKIYHISAPAVCIIPPFSMHKNEGGPYRRININVSVGMLDESEAAFLSELSKTVVFTPGGDGAGLFFNLLESAARYNSEAQDRRVSESYFHVLMHLLRGVKLSGFDDAKKEDTESDNVCMRVASYIHSHYNEEISIQKLCETFFISKNTLCSQFRRLMHCSVMEYRQFVRISKAKELLASTKMSMREIAEECGFSSENYFSLIFKHEVGISPSGYRHAK